MNESTNNELSVNNQVVKSNKMIESMYHLSTMEQKLILSLCSKISSSDDAFKDFHMTVKEFANFMHIDNSNFELNRILKKKCEELASRTLSINIGTPQKPHWYIFNWFHHIEYETGKGQISMQFHEKLEPYLLNIQQQYTKYRLGYVMKFKYEHSFRIYELMKEYEKIGERTISVEDLKSMLFTEEEKKISYQKYSHFKARVINKALEEINKYSDIRVKLIKEEKEGKKVVGLVFEIRSYNYKFPIDILEESEEIRKKTKEEVINLLYSIIARDYKAEISKIKLEIIEKDALVQLYMEIKNGDYKDNNIKYPIPYFETVLIEKHKLMTGEELTKTKLMRYEVEKTIPEKPYIEILDDGEN